MGDLVFISLRAQRNGQNKEGKKELVEKTSIQIKSLPKSVQEELKDAIVLDNEDDAYSRLEDFGS